MNATTADPMDVAPGSIAELFEVEMAEELRQSHLVRLAGGVLGAVRVRSFFSADECFDIMSALDDREFDYYNEEVVVPRIAKLGPTAFQFQSGRTLEPRYWAAAQSGRSARARLLRGGDPMEAALDRVARAWGRPVRYATCGGQPLYGGLIREIDGGARMHFDELVREMPDTFDDAPIAQLAFNCHLCVPEAGGETVVYRRRWRPADEQVARDGYGYDPGLAAEEPRVEIRAGQGDAVLFDSRNYHLVRSATGRRVTLSFFLGVLADGAMVVWS